MSKFKFFIVFLLIAIISLLVYIAFFKTPKMPAGMNKMQGEQTQMQMAWIGPGLYYGYWFDSQDEYNSWYNNNYRNNYDRAQGQRNPDNRQASPRDNQGGARTDGGARAGGGGRGR